jgi:hypothetical protein
MNEYLWMASPILEARTRKLGPGVKAEPDASGDLKVVLDKHGIGLPDSSDEEMAYLAGVVEKDIKAWAAKVAPSLRSGAISPEEFHVLMMNQMKVLADEYKSGKRQLPPLPPSLAAKAAPSAPPLPSPPAKTSTAGLDPRQVEAAKKLIMAQVVAKPVTSAIDLRKMMPAEFQGKIFDVAIFSLAEDGAIHVGKDADLSSFSDADRALLPRDDRNDWIAYVMAADKPALSRPAVPAPAIPRPAVPAAPPVQQAGSSKTKLDATSVKQMFQKSGPNYLKNELVKKSWPDLAELATSFGIVVKTPKGNLKLPELVDAIMSAVSGQPLPQQPASLPVVPKKKIAETPRKDDFNAVQVLHEKGEGELRRALSVKPWQDLANIFTKQFKGQVKGQKGNMKVPELVDAIVQAATKELNHGAAFGRSIRRAGAERRAQAEQPSVLTDPQAKAAALERGRQLVKQVQPAPEPAQDVGFDMDSFFGFDMDSFFGDTQPTEPPAQDVGFDMDGFFGFDDMPNEIVDGNKESSKYPGSVFARLDYGEDEIVGVGNFFEFLRKFGPEKTRARLLRLEKWRVAEIAMKNGWATAQQVTPMPEEQLVNLIMREARKKVRV